GGKWLREYSQFTASAQWSRLSTLTSELAETGIVDVNTRQELHGAQVGWTWNLTPQSQLQTQLGVSDVDYPDGLLFGLVGYHYHNASAGLTNQLSPYTSWSITAFGSRLESSQILTTSRDGGLSLGLARSLSEKAQLQMSIGLSERRQQDLFDTR